MIDSRTADTIKEFLGANYSKKILDYLELKEIKRPNGTNYLRQDIYHVFGGHRNYDALEEAIIDCVEYYKRKREKAKNKLDNILRYENN